MDYKELLKKYIAFVVSQESTDFLGNRSNGEEVFSDEEYTELNRLSPYDSKER